MFIGFTLLPIPSKFRVMYRRNSQRSLEYRLPAAGYALQLLTWPCDVVCGDNLGGGKLSTKSGDS